jgi:hypothetical protein
MQKKNKSICVILLWTKKTKMSKNRQKVREQDLSVPIPPIQTQIQNILKPLPTIDIKKTMRTVAGGNCKDVLALAVCTNALPLTVSGFEAQKTNDWVLANFHIVHVDAVDNNNFGWSKAPFDTKKKIDRNMLKPLYTTDVDGEYVGQTRFWSYIRCSNNMHKGERAPVYDQDLPTTFVLQAHTNLSFFLREDDFAGNKQLISVPAQVSDTVLPPYSVIVLHLSCTHSENAKVGKGLKLRKIYALPPNSTNVCIESLCATVDEFHQRHAAASNNVGICKQIGRAEQAIIKYKPSPDSFIDSANQIVKNNRTYLELCNQQLANGIDGPLYVSTDCILQSLHTKTLDRALRMLDIAFAHEAVTCLVVDKNSRHADDFATVQFLDIDVSELLFLNHIHACVNSDVLPSTPNLCMSWQPSPADPALTTLQWFNPSKKMEMSMPDDTQSKRTVLFELVLQRRSGTEHAKNDEVFYFMDDGLDEHYALRAYHSEQISIQTDGHYIATSPVELFITWQIRPELGQQISGNTTCEKIRKRPKRKLDDIDNLSLEVALLTRQ